MFGRNLVSPRAVLNALNRSLAIIEYDVVGKVLTANENFCKVLGYDLSEIKGQHHSLFVEPDYARSNEYREFWAKLGRGEFIAAKSKRIGKGGKELWIQTSYNPVKAANGRVVKVVTIVNDVTAEKLKNADDEGKLSAILRVQAVIEFKLDGEIIGANENFLALLGYRHEEINGRHHRMFVEPAYANSSDYQEFWRRLNAGEFIAAEFKHIGKGGKEVWIEASYNPIFDQNKKVAKVVEFATDITERVLAVHEIGAGLTRVAGADLEHYIERTLGPAFEKLRSDYNVAVEKCGAALRSVGQSVQAIAAGSQEISSAAENLSQRTEQQAASIEETAAALHQVTATVSKTAEGAKHAREVVAQARADAERSGTVVNQTVEAMSKIEKSSQEISQIIGVIDEIAFQTNLLALNAGVEAARAGEAGRGFAVVASEVRALAQRAADAAKQIKALITTSNGEVDSGVKLVAETGASLTRIASKVAEIITVVDDIANGAQEQATGLQQVNVAVNQMDQTTQENASMAEQSTGASRSLAKETAALSELVSLFKVGQIAGGAAIRRELEKVAPRAFRTGANPVKPPTRVEARKPVPRLDRPLTKKVANAGAGSSSERAWDEF